MRVAGYAAVFGRRDRGGDVVRRGAFAASLAHGAAVAGVPLLWQHRAELPIGRIERLAEDGHGLRVIARLDDSAAGRAAAARVRGGLDGLSFGYRVREGRRTEAGRVLDTLDLIEVSLVAVPMQPAARVHAVEDG